MQVVDSTAIVALLMLLGEASVVLLLLLGEASVVLLLELEGRGWGGDIDRVSGSGGLHRGRVEHFASELSVAEPLLLKSVCSHALLTVAPIAPVAA